MQTSYGRHDHRGRRRYRSRLCARQHGRDHRVLVGRVRDRMVHRSAAPAPPRTERRRVSYRAAVARWPAARMTLCIELETDFDEFSACPDAEAVFGGVIGVAVIVAPRDILIMIDMANDRPRDQNDGCADDESPSYQLCHFYHHLADHPDDAAATDNPGSSA